MRIQAIVDQVRRIQDLFGRATPVVIDVGSDHGYVAERLLKQGLCRSIIASDVAKGPLDNAQQTLKKYVDAGRASLVLSDGLKSIEFAHADVAVIAGMGGDLITRVIETSHDKASRISFFVLQAMTEQALMRQSLSKHMTYLWDHFVADAGKWYQITVFSTLPPEELALSAVDELLVPGTPLRVLSDNREAYHSYLEAKLQKIEKIIGFIREGRAKGSDELVRDQERKARRIRMFLETDTPTGSAES